MKKNTPQYVLATAIHKQTKITVNNDDLKLTDNLKYQGLLILTISLSKIKGKMSK